MKALIALFRFALMAFSCMAIAIVVMPLASGDVDSSMAAGKVLVLPTLISAVLLYLTRKAV